MTRDGTRERGQMAPNPMFYFVFFIVGLAAIMSPFAVYSSPHAAVRVLYLFYAVIITFGIGVYVGERNTEAGTEENNEQLRQAKAEYKTGEIDFHTLEKKVENAMR